MEFPFNISKLIDVDQEGISVLEGRRLKAIGNSHAGIYGNAVSSDSPLEKVINQLGMASASAQGLKAVITTFAKFAGTDQVIVLISNGNTGLGFLKIGKKKLFYRDYFGKVIEIMPVCVLDFYVHESVQRCGYGKILFERFLDVTGEEPKRLAYDRPSPKLISFLSKYYGLKSYTPQNNNFVVYDAYFQSDKENQKTKSQSQDFPHSHQKDYSKGPAYNGEEDPEITKFPIL